jgi:hypothetical protein
MLLLIEYKILLFLYSHSFSPVSLSNAKITPHEHKQMFSGIDSNTKHGILRSRQKIEERRHRGFGMLILPTVITKINNYSSNT